MSTDSDYLHVHVSCICAGTELGLKRIFGLSRYKVRIQNLLILVIHCTCTCKYLLGYKQGWLNEYPWLESIQSGKVTGMLCALCKKRFYNPTLFSNSWGRP